jgi:hypothetical protein
LGKVFAAKKFDGTFRQFQILDKFFSIVDGNVTDQICRHHHLPRSKSMNGVVSLQWQLRPAKQTLDALGKPTSPTKSVG